MSFSARFDGEVLCPSRRWICRETEFLWCGWRLPEVWNRRGRIPQDRHYSGWWIIPLMMNCRATFPHSMITTSTGHLNGVTLRPRYFADTAFWIVLSRSRDQYHREALVWQDYLTRSDAAIVTTEAVCRE